MSSLGSCSAALRALFGVLLVLHAATATAQTATIRGHTIDKITRDPEPGIIVQAFSAVGDTLPGDMLGMTASDLGGQYTLENLRPGAYVLHAAGLGYESGNIRVSLGAGADTLIDIALRECVLGRAGEIAGKSTITGHVRDAASKQPLPGAKIILSSRYRTEDCNYAEWCCTEVSPDSLGQFTLSNLTPGFYSLAPSAPGYSSASAVSITTVPDSVYSINLELTKTPR